MDLPAARPTQFSNVTLTPGGAFEVPACLYLSPNSPELPSKANLVPHREIAQAHKARQGLIANFAVPIWKA